MVDGRNNAVSGDAFLHRGAPVDLYWPKLAVLDPSTGDHPHPFLLTSLVWLFFGVEVGLIPFLEVRDDPDLLSKRWS